MSELLLGGFVIHPRNFWTSENGAQTIPGRYYNFEFIEWTFQERPNSEILVIILECLSYIIQFRTFQKLC